MKRVRVIPVLLIHKGGLVKSVRFKKLTYVGDPINAVKIFNEKEIDEIIVLDIDASREGRGPSMTRIKELASEAFIPLAYGGGVSTIDDVKELFYLGVEKVILNYQAVHNPALITEAAKLVGSQSIVVSIDAGKNLFGKHVVYTKNGTEKTGFTPVDFARRVTEAGAGEIFLNSIDRDGTFGGFDLDLVRDVSSNVNVPLIACGGASTVDDFYDVIRAGASAIAAGSMFVFQRPHKAVLISYPDQEALRAKLYAKL